MVCDGCRAIFSGQALSQEVQQYRWLRRTVGSYRLMFGQLRQVDLVGYLGRNEVDSSWMRIDLTPPGS